MKSRISIEVDFDNNNLPVIQILQTPSLDVRDNLVQAFLQSLQHTSRWARFVYKGHQKVDANEPPVHRWNIETIKPNELREEISLMEACWEGSQPQIKGY